MFESDLANTTAVDRIRMLVNRYGKGSTAVLTSFGVQSGVMLSLVAETFPDLLVVFIDTQSPTSQRDLAYGRQLLKAFGLTNLYVARADVTREDFRVGMEAVGVSPQDKSFHPMSQDVFKMEPLERAVAENKISCLLSGVRRGQTSERNHFKFAEILGNEKGPTKGHPILDWSDDKCLTFLCSKDLPSHPEFGGLVAKMAGENAAPNKLVELSSSSSSRPRRARTRTTLRSMRRSRSPNKECGIHTRGRKSSGTGDRSPPVSNVVVGKPNCRFCKGAKALLDEHGIDYTEAPVDLFGHLIPAHVTTVPVVYLNDNHIGGYADLCQHLGVKDMLNNPSSVRLP